MLFPILCYIVSIATAIVIRLNDHVNVIYAFGFTGRKQGRKIFTPLLNRFSCDMIVMQEVSLSPKITMTDISDLDKWDMIISGSDELLERYVAEDSLDIQELRSGCDQ